MLEPWKWQESSKAVKIRADVRARHTLFLTLLSFLLAACIIAPPGENGIAVPDPTPGSDLQIELKPEAGTPEPTNVPPLVPTPTLEATATNIAPSEQDYVALGNQAYYAGELNGALVYYAQALTLAPNDARIQIGYGQVFFDQGLYVEAWDAFNRAIEMDPASPVAYNWRGQVSYELGNRQQALEDFSRAIEVDPLYVLAYQNRALIQSELGFPEAAIVDLQVYLALAPDSVDLSGVEELMARLIDQTLPFTADREGRLFADDFSDFTSGWNNNPDPIGLASYNSGGYRIEVPVANRAIWGTNDFWNRDMRIEVDVRKIGGSDDNLIGVMCRYQDSNNFYVLVISSDGYYGVGKRINGGPLEPTAAGQLRYSSEIRSGGALNHLTVQCIGNNLSLFVNGALLLTVEDIEIAAGGVGLFGASFSAEGSDIMFDNFEIYEAPRQ